MRISLTRGPHSLAHKHIVILLHDGSHTMRIPKVTQPGPMIGMSMRHVYLHTIRRNLVSSPRSIHIHIQQPHPLLPCRLPEEKRRRTLTELHTAGKPHPYARIRPTGGSPNEERDGSMIGDLHVKLSASDAQSYHLARSRAREQAQETTYVFYSTQF
ncbi:hypothetical protein H4582DRAFT_1941850 [Lactarius indigo]|nr:hypothetical protein H4582DRAFT_1941850 [Lactarius indigo]